MLMTYKNIWAVLALMGCVLLSACGGGSSTPDPTPTLTHIISGTVSGFSGSGLVLQNNAGDDLAIVGNGNFTFIAALGSTTYAITVKTQPAAQNCTVANGTGPLASANVTDVAVTCISPPAPPAATVSYGIQQVILTWSSVSGASYYKVSKAPDGVSSYTALADNLTTTSYTDTVAVHLTDWINTRYKVSACNTAGCTDSAVIAAITIEYLKASNAGAGDSLGYYHFGNSVAVSDDGSTLAVGAPSESSNATGINGNQTDSASNSGAVYVFTRSGSSWSQQAYIKASNTGAGDGFGRAVALSGDGNTLAVGAIGEGSSATGIGGNQSDNSAASSGAVYMFTRAGSTWSQQTYIKASNTGSVGYFGMSVALSVDGNTLAVGAPNESSNATGIGGNQNDNSAWSSGAVYVFTRTGNTWSQQAYIKASNTEYNDYFGFALALSVDGNTLAVGAHNESSNATGIDGNQNDNSAQSGGAVYVFTRTGSAWSQQAYIKASNTDSNDYFGFALALSGDGNTLAVGAFGESSNATGVGGNQDDNSASWSGAVYVFTRTGSSWSQEAYIKASNTDAGDQFGHSVALSADGNTLAVGASYESSNATGVGGNQDDNSAGNSGAVYMFTRTGSTWSQQAYIKASNTGGGDEFGNSVVLSGDGNTLAVGASGEGSNAIGVGGNQNNNSAAGSGAVYVY